MLYEKFSILVEKALERRPFSGLAIMTDDKDRISIASENLVKIQDFDLLSKMRQFKHNS